MGENDFMDAIRRYYDLYRTKGATIDEFSDYLITRLKNKKVNKLVNDWINTSLSSQKILIVVSPDKLFD